MMHYIQEVQVTHKNLSVRVSEITADPSSLELTHGTLPMRVGRVAL